MKGITTRKEALEVLERTAKPVPPGLRIKVDRFRTEDAWGVVECCYSVYGGGYPVDTYYLPDRLIEEHRKRNILGVVAHTLDGQVVGFGALYRSSPPFPGLYEAGQYIVRKEYRNSRAAFEINDFVLKRLPIEADLEALFAEAVCKHLIIQKAARRAGGFETGIELDLMPAGAYEMEGRGAGRIAGLPVFRVLKDKAHDIHVPEVYRDLVGRCVQEIGLDRSIRPVEEGAAETGDSAFTVRYFEEAAVARLSVSKAGNGAVAAIDEFEATASSKACQVRQIFLNIGTGGAARLLPDLFSRGYFFGGYLPRWFDEDGFLLQKLTEKPNLEAIVLYSDWAKELLEFTLRDRDRVSPRAPK
ncbi:MAG: hypothetical protein ACE15E_19920 [Acidobacteriota bacterium]